MKNKFLFQSETDFECRYIVTSGTVKQFKLDFDKCIDFTVKQLKTAASYLRRIIKRK